MGLGVEDQWVSKVSKGGMRKHLGPEGNFMSSTAALEGRKLFLVHGAWCYEWFVRACTHNYYHHQHLKFRKGSFMVQGKDRYFSNFRSVAAFGRRTNSTSLEIISVGDDAPHAAFVLLIFLSLFFVHAIVIVIKTFSKHDLQGCKWNLGRLNATYSVGRRALELNHLEQGGTWTFEAAKDKKQPTIQTITALNTAFLSDT